jgi:hypothetical protein
MQLYLDKSTSQNLYYATDLPNDIVRTVSAFNGLTHKFQPTTLPLHFVDKNPDMHQVWRTDLVELFAGMHNGLQEFWIPYNAISLEPGQIPCVMLEQPNVYQAQLPGMAKPVHGNSVQDCIQQMFREVERYADDSAEELQMNLLVQLVAGLYTNNNPFHKLIPRETDVEFNRPELELRMSHLLRVLQLGSIWCTVYKAPRDNELLLQICLHETRVEPEP